MTHASNMIEWFRVATPSQRFELHAEMVRDFGTGFANALRDLVESVERMRAEIRARPAPRPTVIAFTRGKQASGAPSPGTERCGSDTPTLHHQQQGGVS